jgi:hypothetical protein
VGPLPTNASQQPAAIPLPSPNGTRPPARTFDEDRAQAIYRDWVSDRSGANLVRMADCTSRLWGLLLSQANVRSFKTEPEWHQELLLALNHLLPRFDPTRTTGGRLFGFLRVSLRRALWHQRRRYQHAARYVSYSHDVLDKVVSSGLPQAALSFSGRREAPRYSEHAYWRIDSSACRRLL